ncbi:MAG TPA: glycerophosphodiester phosphodiesterase family protein [Methylomirabilota bacterium]|nr:glycerophosphodiester phosphodiesterase family protein [Methylomirabilota bacterium]
MNGSPNSDSFVQVGDRIVELKVHRCLWSGKYSENSPLAIAECASERVLRTEIDVRALRDGEFVVLHDDRFDRVTDATGLVREATAVEATRPRFTDGTHPLLFSEAILLIAANEYPRTIELDLKDLAPYTRPQAEALVRAAQPLKGRAHFSCPADWNLRRLLAVDPTLGVSLNPHCYIDTELDDDVRLPTGAYGYRDAHPLARQRVSTTADYLRDRFGGIMRLVPRLSEAHVRVGMLERMLDDGVADVAEIFHSLGLKLDVWTLDADTPRWRERLARIVGAGVDVVTTNTAQALARAARGIT